MKKKKAKGKIKVVPKKPVVQSAAKKSPAKPRKSGGARTCYNRSGAPKAARTDFQAGCNEFLAGRSKIKAGRNENQIQRNKIQIRFPSSNQD